MTLKKLAACTAMALLASLSLGATASAGVVIGPILPYLGLSDSPFNGQSFSYFHLETFEEGALTAPGVAASAGAVGTGSLYDSVEGPGPAGHDLFSGCGACGITFTFDAGVLGSLPTSVGIVWTDGDGPNRHFSARDQNGVLIGSITDGSQKFFSTGGDDDPANYRFYGATNAGGISSIFISNDSGGIEVDDLQFGANLQAVGAGGIPEPATWALMLVGIGGLGAAMRRRRRQIVLTA